MQHDGSSATPAWARWRDGALMLSLHVQPGARRTALAGEHGGRLKISLQAPPVDGKANEALLRHLAEVLGLRRAQLELVAGAGSRDKTVAVRADRERLAAALSALVQASEPG
jgi:hypothetical protein